MNDKELEIIKEMQAVAAQMVADDIEENPDSVEEYFNCDCCAKSAPFAGSIMYSNYRLCNDCVLIAEISFALKKIETIHDLLENMEDKRLEELCQYVKQSDNSQNN